MITTKNKDLTQIEWFPSFLNSKVVQPYLLNSHSQGRGALLRSTSKLQKIALKSSSEILSRSSSFFDLQDNQFWQGRKVTSQSMKARVNRPVSLDLIMSWHPWYWLTLQREIGTLLIDRFQGLELKQLDLYAITVCSKSGDEEQMLQLLLLHYYCCVWIMLQSQRLCQAQ